MQPRGEIIHHGEQFLALAQSAGGSGRSLTPYLVAVGVLIVVVVFAGLVLIFLRGRLNQDEDDQGFGAGGVLETMRAMRDRGEISEEEYRTAQAAIVAKAAADKGEQPEPDRPVPARVRTRPPLPGEIRAEPGFDLTGEPLPPPVRDSDHDPDPPSR